MPAIPRREVERVINSYQAGELPPLREENPYGLMAHDTPSERTVGVELEAFWLFGEVTQKRKDARKIPVGVSEEQLVRALSVLRFMSSASSDEEFLASHTADLWAANLPIVPDMDPAKYFKRMDANEVHVLLRDVVSHYDRWNVRPDGSVPDGWEIVSPPFKLDSGFDALARVLKMMGEIGLGPWLDRWNDPNVQSRRESQRQSGMHVHVDARDLNDSQCGAVVLAHRYSFPKLSKLYPSCLPEHRENGTYSRTLSHIMQQRGMPLTLDTTAGEAFQYNHSSSFHRYLEVNTHARGKHNTLEFRTGFLSLIAEEVIRYVKHLRAIVDWAANRQALLQPTTKASVLLEDFFLTMGDYASYRELYQSSDKFTWQGLQAAVRRLIPDMETILSNRTSLALFRELTTSEPRRRRDLLRQIDLVRNFSPEHPQLNTWDYVLDRFREDQEAVNRAARAA